MKRETVAKTLSRMDGDFTKKERKALDKAISEFTRPSLEAYVQQVRWERDTAIAQLRELGYEFCEKPRLDDCISREQVLYEIDKYAMSDESYTVGMLRDNCSKLPSLNIAMGGEP